MEAQKKSIRLVLLSTLIIFVPFVSLFCLPPARSSEVLRRDCPGGCVFCDIAAHRQKSVIVDEDDDFIVFEDINPKAAIHYLIVPKKHVKDLSSADKSVLARLITKAQDLGRELKISDYRIMINNGFGAGQTVGHLHMHFLSGKKR